MLHFYRVPLFVVALVFALASGYVPRAAHAISVTSGPNLSADGPIIDIPSITFPGNAYQVDIDLTFDPVAGPMTKHFGTPRYENGQPVPLIGSQPLPFVINENFTLTGTRQLVSDWHERIITPGWVWVTPGQTLPGFPNLFPEGQSLITRNGTPYPFTPSGPPSGDPTRIDVIFNPIPSGNILDVHKALLWVGATGPNDIWGDSPDETVITIIEFPTPEPSSMALAAIAAMGLVSGRRLLSRQRMDRTTASSDPS
jgi:hypothetical protein